MVNVLPKGMQLNSWCPFCNKWERVKLVQADREYRCICSRCDKLIGVIFQQEVGDAK